jgi:hypothetical protein
MIDVFWKTELLMEELKHALPIQATIPLPLARVLQDKSPDLLVPAQCNVVEVIYSGDAGGILCRLAFHAPESHDSFVVSITHLTFHKKLPFAREIERYQRHRTKKLRQQATRDP